MVGSERSGAEGRRSVPAGRLVAAAVCCFAVAAALATEAFAGARNFAFVYEADTQPKGTLEYEQFVTWKTDKRSDRSFDRLEFRHELEYGLTDATQIALYLADWQYQDGRSVSDDGAQYKDTAVEVIHQLSNPTTDWIGSAIYGEFKMGPELVEVEGKLILQKNVGKWVFAYNAALEAEWEGAHYQERTGTLEQTAGVSYEIHPRFTVGAELLHEIEWADWSKASKGPLYMGPTVSYRGKGWFVTVGALMQVTDRPDEPDLQVRMLLGVDLP